MPATAPEILNLSDGIQVRQQRATLLSAFPGFLDIVGAHEQRDQFNRGEYPPVVEWFTGKVSVGGAGINAGDFGLTVEQTDRFNPLAQSIGLIAPSARLWAPEDDLPPGARVGDFADYSVLPDWDSLPEIVQNAQETIVVDALVDGTIGRIDTGLGLAVRSRAARDPDPNVTPRLTVITGMRAVKPREGATGLYKEFLPEGADPKTPIDVAFPSATDAALAILQKRCSSLELFYEVEDPQAGSKPDDRTHPTLGSRTWIARYYNAVDAATGQKVMITVVNGEPIMPSGQELNRSRVEPAPVAEATFREYLGLPLTYSSAPKNLAVSYPHLMRIGARLFDALRRNAPYGLGSFSLIGSMPQRATWYKMEGNHQNGGTLCAKELITTLRGYNRILGRKDLYDMSPDQ